MFNFWAVECQMENGVDNRACTMTEVVDVFLLREVAEDFMRDMVKDPDYTYLLTEYSAIPEEDDNPERNRKKLQLA